MIIVIFLVKCSFNKTLKATTVSNKYLSFTELPHFDNSVVSLDYKIYNVNIV